MFFSTNRRPPSGQPRGQLSPKDALAQAAVRGWPGLLLAGACAEQLLEEATGGLTRRQVGGPWALVRRGGAAAVLRPLLRHLDHAALVLDRRLHAAVVAVDVTADLQLAVVIHERGLIGQVDRDEG